MKRSTRMSRVSWNYRVTHRPKSPMEGFQIREVYYNDAGDVVMYSVDGITPFGDLVEELEVDMNYMVDAMNYASVNLDNVDYLLSIKDETGE